MFAHGYDVSAATYSVLLDDLTRAGMIVAAPEFPGESTAYPGPAVESDLVNEPCDMEFVAASLEHHPPAALRDTLAERAADRRRPLRRRDRRRVGRLCIDVFDRPDPRGRCAVSRRRADDGRVRFGKPPPLLAMTGTADEINPLGHTLALYGHVPAPALLVTVDGGSHLGTFTTDPDLARIDAMIADFVFMVADHDAGARTDSRRPRAVAFTCDPADPWNPPTESRALHPSRQVTALNSFEPARRFATVRTVLRLQPRWTQALVAQGIEHRFPKSSAMFAARRRRPLSATILGERFADVRHQPPSYDS